MTLTEEYLEFISVINAAHAGELFLKAAIAKEHPLLIFKDIFLLDDGKSPFVDVERLIESGRTHDFEKLPQILWAATGKRLPNIQCFNRLRKARNSIQHFCASEKEDFRRISLEFIYTVIDPLIAETFGLCAIEFHEDHNIGYDYIVERLIQEELKFTLPGNFDVGEISLKECLEGRAKSYRQWMERELRRIDRLDLLK